jgi:hypothetical protein
MVASVAACGGGDSDSESTPTTGARIVVDPTQADYLAALPDAELVRAALKRAPDLQDPKPIADPGLPALCGKKAPKPRAIAGNQVTFTTPRKPVRATVSVQGWKDGELDVPWLTEAGVIDACTMFTSNGTQKAITGKETTGHNLAVTIADLATGRGVSYDFMRLEDYVATVRLEWDSNKVKISPKERERLAVLVVDKAKPVLGIPW